MEISVITAYVVSFVCFVIFFGLAFLSAQVISFKPDNSDHGQRKIWFWVWAGLMVLVVIGVNLVSFYGDISVPAQKNSYLIATGVSALLILVAYILLGLIISKNTHGKPASWFN